VNLGDSDSGLPDTVDLSQEVINRYYPLWLWWWATDRKFLPSQLMAEPYEPFSVILELDSYYYRVSEQLKKEPAEDGE